VLAKGQCGEIESAAFIELTGKVRFQEVRIRMKITSKGQVTFPLRFREQFSFFPNTEPQFIPSKDGKQLILMKASQQSTRSKQIIGRLRGKGSGNRSTDERRRLMRSEK
jgi:bifunctional DNA-binding transcriptional regulator/antitoxin component of YhaV-PrlF toxin-antitoxin module